MSESGTPGVFAGVPVVMSESGTPGIFAGVPVAKRDETLGAPHFTFTLRAACSAPQEVAGSTPQGAAKAQMFIAQRVALAQRSVSPCPNIEVIMADGRKELKSWITVESLLNQVLVQNVPGIVFVSKL